MEVEEGAKVKSLRIDIPIIVSVEEGTPLHSERSEKTEDERSSRLAMSLSLYANILIALAKLISFISTGSLSVLAALLDSCLDLATQGILNWSSRLAKSADVTLYPAGASRLEPVGVVVSACLMSVGSFFVISEALQEIGGRIGGAAEEEVEDEHFLAAILSMVGVIFVKGVLYFFCMSVYKKVVGEDSSLQAVAMDHRNDVLSNLVALVALIIISTNSDLWWVDPLGALAISVYIIYSWVDAGKEEVDKLAGITATQDFIDKLTEVAESHHEMIVVDTIRAYHFGPRLLVECEIVLPGDMVLRETHEIGMGLQYKLEKIDEIERAFVHVDFAKREYDEHSNSRKFDSYQKQVMHNRESPTNSASSRKELDDDSEV